MLADLRERERVDPVGELHHRAASFAGTGIGHADDRNVGNLGVSVQHVLHLGGRDVLGVTNDDILQSPRDPDVAGRQHQPEVAGAEEAVIVERVVHELGVRVRAEELRPEEAQLTRFARRALAAVRADDPDLHTR